MIVFMLFGMFMQFRTIIMVGFGGIMECGLGFYWSMNPRIQTICRVCDGCGMVRLRTAFVEVYLGGREIRGHLYLNIHWG